MAEKTKKIANIDLNTAQSTDLTFSDLRTWVIWQFPQNIDENSLCGAVRPPIAEHSWYAASIQYQLEKIKVYGHLKETFDTPETAAEYLHTMLTKNGD